MSVNWKLAKNVFKDAIELPRNEHESFVSRRCANKDTCDHVLKLLRVHFEDSEFLEAPFAHHDSTIPLSTDALIGRQLGNFFVQRRIGKGGMGAVYEAHQSQPNRQVAIKVLRNDTSIDKQTLLRFQNEAEVLARLQHPNIAHVYESGTFKTDEGRQPWFAMELVDGFRLKEFLRQRQWNEKRKLNLFLKICDAVDYAHNRGVIHRDLKPANILIKAKSDNQTNRDDNDWQPKIVDFGIARVTEATRYSATLTGTQSILGTLDYLSPEQVSDDRNNLDHRCDVYSLGVIAFEMLTDRLPHDRRTGTLPKIITRIESENSQLLRSVDNSFSKDLELVVAKATESEAVQRYHTVQAFADDIRRYLRQEPVSARRPSPIYRASKFVRRNKILVTGVATTIFSLIGGIITYAMIAKQANESAEAARYEARKTVAVNSFITNDFLTSLLNSIRVRDPGDSVAVTELVKSASDNVDTIFEDRPLVEATVRNEIGTIYYNLRDWEMAAAEYQQALDLWETGLGPLHPDTLKAVNNLAQTKLASSEGSHPETIALAERAYHGRIEVLGLQDAATLASLNNLARIYQSLGRIADAEQLYVNGLEQSKNDSTIDPSTRLTLASNLGTLYIQLDRLDEATKLQLDSYESAKRIFGDNHAITLNVGLRYVRVLDKAKRYEKALKALQPILEHYKKVEKDDPGPMRLKAKIYRHRGDKAKALECLLESLEIARNDSDKNRLIIDKIHRDIRRLE